MSLFVHFLEAVFPIQNYTSINLDDELSYLPKHSV